MGKLVIYCCISKYDIFGSLKENTYCLTVSVGQEFGRGLARWFSLKFSPEVAFKSWPGCESRDKLGSLYCRSLGPEGQLLKNRRQAQ